MIARFNARLAAGITRRVGTMWTAYLFTTLSLVSAPAAFRTHDPIIIVGWVAQTFLQLVLLPIIIVGQNQQGASVELKIDETHTASLAEFELAKEQRAAHADEMANLKAIGQALHVHLTGTEHPGA